MEYKREIDGLRAVAVIPVILFHAGFSCFSGGFVGVDVFFVISGYLITTTIINDLKAGDFSLTKFYERRARRILPALFLVLFFCLPLAFILLLPSDLLKFSKSLVSTSTFTSNLLFWRWSGYFDIASELNPLIHTWSLSVEEQFYLFFPIFFIFIARSSYKTVFYIIFVIFLFSFSIGQFLSIDKPFFTFYLLPTRAWELLLGSLLSIYFTNNKVFKLNNISLEILSLVGLVGIGASVFFFSKSTPTPSFFTLIPTLSTVLIIYSTLHSPNKVTIVGKLLSTRLMVGIGLLSYSAYLWHQPLFAFVKYNFLNRNELIYVLIVFLTFLFSFFSWKYIETPFRNGSNFSRQFIFKFSIISSLLFIFFGLSGILTNGFSQRLPAEDRELALLDVSEQGRYVDKRFFFLQDKVFQNDERKKVLLIGDSFARDLTNAVFETNLVNHFQISTHNISVNCGNLYQIFDKNLYISKDQLPGCVRNGWYEAKSLQIQLLEADEIWLASAWPYWVAEKLNESIEKLESDLNKKIIVFGVKDFGQVSIMNLLQIPFEQRIRIAQSPSIEKKIVNTYMKHSIPTEKYIDLMGLLCVENDSCALFDENANILSHDGGHLTKAGAKYLGLKLELILIK
jgi:peptidoglycan/LPS O-acetylase OafA/YrhL